MPVINEVKRMRWEDHEFEASLCYTFLHNYINLSQHLKEKSWRRLKFQEQIKTLRKEISMGSVRKGMIKSVTKGVSF
jgi:hypothetical protein